MKSTKVVIIPVVTPEMAKMWLMRNKGNRRIRTQHVKNIIRMMMENKWGVSDSKIMFDTKGNLINGQHRLIACLISGVNLINVTVEFEVPQEAVENLDTGWRRSVSDNLRMPYATGKVGKLMMQREGYNKVSVSRATLLEYIKGHRDAIEWATQLFRSKHAPGLGKAAIISVLARAYYHADKGRLQDFCEILRTGTNYNAHDDAAMNLRTLLFNTYKTDEEILFRTEHCLSLFLGGKKYKSKVGRFNWNENPFPTQPVLGKIRDENDMPLYSQNKLPELDDTVKPEKVLF
jgi:hypothetical protein